LRMKKKEEFEARVCDSHSSESKAKSADYW
jgi:hypothetical protein